MIANETMQAANATPRHFPLVEFIVPFLLFERIIFEFGEEFNILSEKSENRFGKIRTRAFNPFQGGIPRFLSFPLSIKHGQPSLKIQIVIRFVVFQTSNERNTIIVPISGILEGRC